MLFLTANWGLLWQYPFYPDVWGTVSDWVMILVTGITAYFLWKTLQSQSEVQKLQQEITKIERFKHKERVKPNFILSNSLEGFKSGNEEFEVFITFKINVINHTAKFVKITFSRNLSPVDSTDSFKTKEYEILYKEDNVEFPQVLVFSNEYDLVYNKANEYNEYRTFYKVDVDIKFKDVDDCSYSKKISYQVDENRIVDISHFPVIEANSM